MTEYHHVKWSSEPLCISLYLGLNPHPLSSKTSVLPARQQWQMDIVGENFIIFGEFVIIVGKGFIIVCKSFIIIGKHC